MESGVLGMWRVTAVVTKEGYTERVSGVNIDTLNSTILACRNSFRDMADFYNERGETEKATRYAGLGLDIEHKRRSLIFDLKRLAALTKEAA